VLVLNFLNRSNAADARLFELLEKKLNLFDGVFGASDEILGALGSGVDFERRVLEIYQSCRMPEEIDAAFDALRKDLESRIDQRMTRTRSLLLERFDGGTELEFVIMVIAVSCVKLLSAHNSTQHTSRKHKV
jgi:hypothetical protein